jgi:GWT1
MEGCSAFTSSVASLCVFGNSCLSTHNFAWNRNDETAVPIVLAAINRNGFPVFVIANLLTGAVNLSVNTLEYSHSGAMTILVAYMCIVGVVTIMLDRVKKYFPQSRLQALRERKQD